MTETYEDGTDKQTFQLDLFKKNAHFKNVSLTCRTHKWQWHKVTKEMYSCCVLKCIFSVLLRLKKYIF